MTVFIYNELVSWNGQKIGKLIGGRQFRKQCDRAFKITLGRDRFARRVSKTLNLFFQTLIEKNKIDEYEDKFQVLSKRLYSGQTIIRVVSDQKPAESFDQIDANLEDVYFNCLKNSN